MNAPILITVYDRDKHFKKTIESLLACNGADETVVFIALDGPASNSASEKQISIKKYISKIKGFKKVNLIQRDENYGAVDNFNLARNEVFLNYDTIIITEDDNVFSPHFLSYMNKGLELYKSNKDIFAICGYLEPVILKTIDDTFSRQGFTSNGYGVWKNKYQKMENSNFLIVNERLSFINFQKMIDSMGYHVVSGLIYSEKMKYFLLDYYICYYLYKKSMRCIFPKLSLVRNIGQDGSGMHSGTNHKLQNQDIYEKEINMHTNSIDSSVLDRDISHYHKRTFMHSIYQYYKFIKLSK